MGLNSIRQKGMVVMYVPGIPVCQSRNNERHCQGSPRRMTQITMETSEQETIDCCPQDRTQSRDAPGFI